MKSCLVPVICVGTCRWRFPFVLSETPPHHWPLPVIHFAFRRRTMSSSNSVAAPLISSLPSHAVAVDCRFISCRSSLSAIASHTVTHRRFTCRHRRRFTCRRSSLSLHMFLFFVLNQLFITRYMWPGGPWQRLCRCPLRGNGGGFYIKNPFPTSNQLARL